MAKRHINTVENALLGTRKYKYEIVNQQSVCSMREASTCAIFSKSVPEPKTSCADGYTVYTFCEFSAPTKSTKIQDY